MKPRILFLPLAAAVIGGLVLWRLQWESEQSGVYAPVTSRQLAPRFELYDQHSQLVKFERYLGRTRILVLFTGSIPLPDHPLVQLLLENQSVIQQAGMQIVMVTLSTPFAIRQLEQSLGTSFDFPVLADFDNVAPGPAHRSWGLAPNDSSDVRGGVFLVDRDGTVAWNNGAPQPVAAPDEAITAIAQGRWPE